VSGNEIPMVSVIIPCYNSANYVEQAIKSVLKQNISKEIILIDDHSNDNLLDVLMKYINDKKIVYIKNSETIGVAGTRNIGIDLAKGKYIAFLDADDWWDENKLEQQVKHLEHNNGVLCCTGRELYSDEGIKLNKYIGVQPVITYQMLLKNNSIACSSVLLLTEVAREFYMTHDEYHEDYLMWLNILKKYSNAFGLDKPMLKYRLSKNGKSRNKFKSMKMTYGVYRTMKIKPIRRVYYLLQYIKNGLIKYK
jgi:teichuronic acid biosynthesis glycosyltransferase TuaG